MLFMATQPQTARFVELLTKEELAQDPKDFLAGHVVQWFHQLSISTQHFAGIYLLGHGLIKIGLVIGLLRGSRWSYPTALVFLTAFIFYQIYRLARTPSLGLYVLTTIDLIVVILIVREWCATKKECSGGAESASTRSRHQLS